MPVADVKAPHSKCGLRVVAGVRIPPSPLETSTFAANLNTYINRLNAIDSIQVDNRDQLLFWYVHTMAIETVNRRLIENLRQMDWGTGDEPAFNHPGSRPILNFGSRRIAMGRESRLR
jgi:hypothetical protein